MLAGLQAIKTPALIMKNNIYLNCKSLLISEAKEAKRLNPKDKPYQRQCINDQHDQLIRQIDWYVMKETISESKANVYKAWLTNLACKLHP